MSHHRCLRDDPVRLRLVPRHGLPAGARSRVEWLPDGLPAVPHGHDVDRGDLRAFDLPADERPRDGDLRPVPYEWYLRDDADRLCLLPPVGLRRGSVPRGEQLPAELRELPHDTTWGGATYDHSFFPLSGGHNGVQVRRVTPPASSRRSRRTARRVTTRTTSRRQGTSRVASRRTACSVTRQRPGRARPSSTPSSR